MKPAPTSRGTRVAQFIEQYCIIPDGHRAGEPFRLTRWQRRFILAVYDNPVVTRRANLSIARKNGKTAFVAALCLAHTAGPESVRAGQVAVGATTVKQAGITFDYAKSMILASPRLAGLFDIVDSRKLMTCRLTQATLRVMSSDAAGAHGLSLSLALLDELGQLDSENSLLYDAFVSSQGAHRRPLLICLSTQSAESKHFFARLIDTDVASGDPKVVTHVYAAPEGAALDDDDAIRAANPSIEDGLLDMDQLRQSAKEAARLPSSESMHRRYVLNQRVVVGVPTFLSREVFEACGEEPEPFGDMEVFGGLDLSAVSDLTAFVLAARGPAGVWSVRTYAWLPEEGLSDKIKRDGIPFDALVRAGHLFLTPGPTIDYDAVAAQILALVAPLNLRKVFCDSYRMDIQHKSFVRSGASEEFLEKLENFGQGMRSMTPALDTVERLFLDRKVRHGAHPILAMCAANAIPKTDDAGNRKLTKKESRGRIDALVAAAMAIGGGEALVSAEDEDLSSWISAPLRVRY